MNTHIDIEIDGMLEIGIDEYHDEVLESFLEFVNGCGWDYNVYTTAYIDGEEVDN